jgi:hypothetical protein
LHVDENLYASLNFSAVRTSIASSVEVDVKVKGDGQEKKRIDEALRNIEPVDTLNPLKN